MKKLNWTTISAALLLSMSLTACGSAQGTGGTPAPQSEPTKTESSVAPGVESTVPETDSTQSTVAAPVPEPDHSKAYAAYLKVLEENKDRIAAYTWQNEIWDNDELSYDTVKPVALADAFGDDTPELIFMRTPDMNDNTYSYVSSLVVCTYENESIKTLYDEKLDIQVAGGTCYCVFTGKDRSLYIYDSIGDEGVEYNYHHLTASEDALTEAEKLSHTSYPNDSYDAYIDTYYVNDAEVTKEEYETAKNAYYDNTDRILLSGDNDEEFLISYSHDHDIDAMTYDDALAKLRELAGAAAGGQAAASADSIFDQLNGLEMGFASGAGGWSSDLIFGENGTFTGSYHDSDMGDTGDGYPNGTIYVCEYKGRFEIANIISDTAYTLKLAESSTEKAAGEEWIEDGIRYVASDPYGIAGGDEFILYLPGTPSSDLTEDGLSWYKMPRAINDDEMPAALPCYGLYNVNAATAFYSY